MVPYNASCSSSILEWINFTTTLNPQKEKVSCSLVNVNTDNNKVFKPLTYIRKMRGMARKLTSDCQNTHRDEIQAMFQVNFKSFWDKGRVLFTRFFLNEKKCSKHSKSSRRVTTSLPVRNRKFFMRRRQLKKLVSFRLRTRITQDWDDIKNNQIT